MTQKLKVAFFSYPSAFQNVGGGEILLLKTKEYLEKEGIEVKLFNMWEDKLKDFDILHVFSTVKYCLGLIQTAKNLGVKVVLTPIFFSTFQRALYEYGNITQKFQACLRHVVKVILPRFPSDKRKIFTLADVVIPNSEIELKQIKRLFSIPQNKMSIIPNCVDSSFAYGSKDLFVSRFHIENFILSVGRIEPRKNQLNLIKALKGFPAPLVIIGDAVSDYRDYYDECRKQAGDNVYFIKRVPHQDPLLKSAYFACRCFVSQGWFETPGLAALEAGLSGANIATTEGGCTREYFQNMAEYFNPASLKSIRFAVQKAFNKEKNSSLKEHIKKNFLWEIAAQKNISVYRKITGS